MRTQKKIRFGVIGCSRVAKKSAVPAIIDSQFAELAMIGSRSPENARTCAEELGCSSSGTYEDVLNNKDVDAVYISLPNSLHEDWTVRAAHARKHVWCEKPAALTHASAKKMVEACKENNVRLMEGFMFLYHPQHAMVKELIRDGAIGEVLGFEGRFALPMPDAGNIRRNAGLGGGSYNDAGAYPIRASSMIFNEVPESVACTLTIDPDMQVDVAADVVMDYSNGRSARISSAFGAEFQSTYSVKGSAGRISTERAYAVPKDMPVKIFLENGTGVKEITAPLADHFRLMTDDFCKEILAGNANTKNYEDDLLSQARILNAGRISDEYKRPVRLSELA
jgi:D-xylose 1-dehydrogenase (NADP+, D-xylono-1,5-lactone-forming)